MERPKRGTYEKAYVIEEILEARGPPERRFYHTKWVGYSKKKATWEPVRHFQEFGSMECTDDFWAVHPELDMTSHIKAEGEHRCEWCNKNYKLASGLKGHHTKGCRSKPQCLAKGTRTAKAIRRDKLKRQQDNEATVTLFGNQLNNVFDFSYLGHLFQADGDPFHAVEVRAAMVKATYGKLHEFWSSSILNQDTKIRLYKCTVWSKLTYGRVAWKLTEKTRRFLRS